MTFIITLNDRNKEAALLFDKVDVDDLDFSVFIPKRLMLGEGSHDRLVFTEFASGIRYLNFYSEWDTCLSEGFEMLSTLEAIKEETGMEDLQEALNEFWRQVEDCVFFYGRETLGGEATLAYLNAEDFFYEFGADLRRLDTLSRNQLLDNYISGKITPEEYKRKLNLRPSNVINLFDKKE